MRKMLKIINIALIFMLINIGLPDIINAGSFSLRPLLVFSEKKNRPKEQESETIRHFITRINGDDLNKTLSEYDAQIEFLLNIKNEAEDLFYIRAYFRGINENYEYPLEYNSFIDTNLPNEFPYFYYQLISLLNIDDKEWDAMVNEEGKIKKYYEFKELGDMDRTIRTIGNNILIKKAVKEMVLNDTVKDFHEPYKLRYILEKYIWDPRENPESRKKKSKRLKTLLKSEHNEKHKKIVYEYLHNLYKIHGYVAKWLAIRTGENNKTGLNFDEYIKNTFPLGVEEKIYTTYAKEKELVPIDSHVKIGYACYHALRGDISKKYVDLFKEVLNKEESRTANVFLVRDELCWMIDHGMYGAAKDIARELDNTYITDCIMLKEFQHILNMCMVKDYRISVNNKMEKILQNPILYDFNFDSDHFTTWFQLDLRKYLNALKKSFFIKELSVRDLSIKLSEDKVIEIGLDNFLGLVKFRASKEGTDTWIDLLLKAKSSEDDDWTRRERIRMGQELGNHMLSHPEDLKYYRECMENYLTNLMILKGRLYEILEYFRDRSLVPSESHASKKLGFTAPATDL